MRWNWGSLFPPSSRPAYARNYDMEISTEQVGDALAVKVRGVSTIIGQNTYARTWKSSFGEAHTLYA